jgi:putative transposase
MNASHATKVLAEFADHYNRHRPQRSRGQLPPDASQQPPPTIDIRNRQLLLRTRVLGGAINEYRYAA